MTRRGEGDPPPSPLHPPPSQDPATTKGIMGGVYEKLSPYKIQPKPTKRKKENPMFRKSNTPNAKQIRKAIERVENARMEWNSARYELLAMLKETDELAKEANEVLGKQSHPFL